MVSRTENPSLRQSAREETAIHNPALEGGPRPAVVPPQKTLSQIAESTIGGLLSLYALRRPLSSFTLVIIDSVALFAAFSLSSYLIDGDRWAERVVHLAPILLTVWLAIFTAHHLYDRASKRRSPVALLSAVLWSSGLLAVGGALYSELSLSPKVVLLGTLFALPLEGGIRILYEQGTKYLHEKKWGSMPSLLVGNDEERQWVRRSIERTPSAWA